MRRLIGRIIGFFWKPAKLPGRAAALPSAPVPAPTASEAHEPAQAQQEKAAAGHIPIAREPPRAVGKPPEKIMLAGKKVPTAITGKAFFDSKAREAETKRRFEANLFSTVGQPLGLNFGEFRNLWALQEKLLKEALAARKLMAVLDPTAKVARFQDFVRQGKKSFESNSLGLNMAQFLQFQIEFAIEKLGNPSAEKGAFLDKWREEKRAAMR